MKPGTAAVWFVIGLYVGLVGSPYLLLPPDSVRFPTPAEVSDVRAETLYRTEGKVRRLEDREILTQQLQDAVADLRQRVGELEAK